MKNYKIGENGPEGRCALFAVYVIKGETKFRDKSVGCPDWVPSAEEIRDPFRLAAGARYGCPSVPHPTAGPERADGAAGQDERGHVLCGATRGQSAEFDAVRLTPGDGIPG